MRAETTTEGRRVYTRKESEHLVGVFRPAVVVVPVVDREGVQHTMCKHMVSLGRDCEDCQYVWDKFERGL